MSKTFEYPIHMTPEVAKYWYDRFIEFHQQNEEFRDITFAEYLGNQVLSSMMLIFQGQPKPSVGEEPDEEPEADGEADHFNPVEQGEY